MRREITYGLFRRGPTYKRDWREYVRSVEPLSRVTPGDVTRNLIAANVIARPILNVNKATDTLLKVATSKPGEIIPTLIDSVISGIEVRASFNKDLIDKVKSRFVMGW